MGFFRDNVLDFVLFVIINCSSQYLALFPTSAFPNSENQWMWPLISNWTIMLGNLFKRANT